MTKRLLDFDGIGNDNKADPLCTKLNQHLTDANIYHYASDDWHEQNRAAIDLLIADFEEEAELQRLIERRKGKSWIQA